MNRKWSENIMTGNTTDWEHYDLIKNSIALHEITIYKYESLWDLDIIIEDIMTFKLESRQLFRT